MSKLLSLLVLVVFLSNLTVQTAPAQTKALKDEKNTCQVLVPADWQPDSVMSGTMKDPKNLISVSVFWEEDYQVEPMNDMMIKMQGVEKLIENTGQRIFYQGRAANFGPVPSTPWTVYTPAPQRGACHCTITGKPGASEEVVRKIALTLGPAK